MSFDPAIAKAVLDWMCGGAAAAQPGGRWVDWATQSPNYSSAYDGPFTKRQTCTFYAAVSPAVGVSNQNAMSGTATAAAAVTWFNLYESSAGGRRILYGTVGGVACASGDAPCFRAGDLTITLT